MLNTLIYIDLSRLSAESALTASMIPFPSLQATTGISLAHSHLVQDREAYSHHLTMKLLNTRTQQVHQVHQVPLQPPPYATLSYSWETPAESTDLTPARLQRACTQARLLGLEWLWLPSLCIDHASSAEISESINSRFRVFRDSVVCLVYLEHVSVQAGKTTSEVAGTLLRNSPWLRRIWTLTELIASKELIFFDRDGREFGTKMSLLPELSKATGIDRPVLETADCLSNFSVGRRMSWASDCSYEREEDLAYALIGLFGVSMMILYGEGPLAFLRLQDEISRTTDDASLFCWQAEPHTAEGHRGLLAHSPAEFSHFASIPPIAPLHIHGDVQLTSAGIVITDVSVSHGFGSDIVLPLYFEDGTATYGMCLRSWKGRYVKPYLGFTRLNAVVTQRVRRICIIRDVDSTVSANTAAYFPHIERAQPPTRKWDGAMRGQRQYNVPVYHFGSHASFLPFASSSKELAGESHRYETWSNIYTHHYGHKTPGGCTGSAFRESSPEARNSRTDLSGSFSIRSRDTSAIADYRTPEHDSPPPDDICRCDTLPYPPTALEPDYEFTLVKNELTDHIIRLLHNQVKHLSKRLKAESRISRKRKRQRTEDTRTYHLQEGKGCLDSRLRR